MTYVVHVLAMLAPQLVAVAALQMLHRQGALLSLHQAAVMGTGGYVFALIATGNMGLAIIASAIAATVILVPLYLVVATGQVKRFVLASIALQLAFNGVVRVLPLTGGEAGIRGIDSYSVAGWRIRPGSWECLLIELGLSVVLLVGLLRIERSTFRIKLIAAADDELLAAGLGLRPRAVRIIMLGLTGLAAGVAGALIVAFRGGISPDDFGLAESVLLISATALAWDRTIGAALVSGMFLVIAAEALKVIGVGTELEKIAYGAALLVAIGHERNDE